MKTRNTQEPLKKQIKDINMSYNEIFSIIRVGTYEQYEKSIAGVVDIDCCNKYKQNLLQEAIAAYKNDIAKDLINRNIDLNHRDSNGQTPQRKRTKLFGISFNKFKNQVLHVIIVPSGL